MMISDLTSYAEARKLCENKRFADKGRRLDNYTRLRLVNPNTSDEYITIEQGWRSAYEIARLYKNDTAVVPNVRRFTSHQMNYLMGGYVARNKQKYYEYHSYGAGLTVLATAPITFRLGRYWVPIEGKPVPAIEKDKDQSTEWSVIKRQFDKVMTVMMKMHTAVQYAEPAARHELSKDASNHLSAQSFVEAVRANDHDRMIRMTAQSMAWWGSYRQEIFCESLHEHYKSYYRRHRTAILVAAGARKEVV